MTELRENWKAATSIAMLFATACLWYISQGGTDDENVPAGHGGYQHRQKVA